MDIEVFGQIAIYLIAALLVPLISFGIPKLFTASKHSYLKLETYECGEIPYGTARTSFSIQYYTFALMFVVFDIEALFMFPWAAVLKDIDIVVGVVEMSIFVGVFVVGLVYAWTKGALKWVMNIPE